MCITIKTNKFAKILLLFLLGFHQFAIAQWKISGLAAMECSKFLETKTLDNEVARNFISNYMFGYIDGVNSSRYYFEKEKMKTVVLPQSADEILAYVTQQCLVDPKQSIFRVGIKYTQSLTVN